MNITTKDSAGPDATLLRDAELYQWYWRVYHDNDELMALSEAAGNAAWGILDGLYNKVIQAPTHTVAGYVAKLKVIDLQFLEMRDALEEEGDYRIEALRSVIQGLASIATASPAQGESRP